MGLRPFLLVKEVNSLLWVSCVGRQTTFFYRFSVQIVFLGFTIALDFVRVFFLSFFCHPLSQNFTRGPLLP